MDKIINNDSMINLRESLAALHDRRQPITEIPASEKLGKDYDPIFESIRSSISNEGVRYILGAMQPIPRWSTEFLYQQGKNFSKKIIKNLNLPVTFHFQGSVPLNIHIKSASDLDILFVHTKNLYVPKRIDVSLYQPRIDTVLDTILSIKTKCKIYFDITKIDYKYKDKSIKILNLLPVKTDIVPSCWYDTVDYQLSNIEYERGIIILDEKNNKSIQNYPFKHIYLFNTKNTLYNDKLGKCIRLLKNIKADLPNSDVITLSSFDITSFIYHMPERISDFSNIKMNDDLALASCMHKYIQYALNNKGEFSRLYVPDQSRHIFDSPHKFSSLQTLDKNLSEILSIANHSVLY